MGIAPIIYSLGDSPEVELQAGATVEIAPLDNSIDSNRVRIVGTGTISSLGVAFGALTRAQYLNDDEDVAATDDVITVTKRVSFVPTAPGTITLHHNPPTLTLLGAADRTISANAFGEYQSDENGNWTELSYSQTEITPDQHKRGGLVSIVTYMASGTITIPANATRAWVRMYGASGASGAAQVGGSSELWASAGTGSGGYLEKFLTGLTPGKTLIYTRGAGGVAANYPNPGGNGGNTILASGTQTIATLTANGSLGTGLGIGSPISGSLGGAATGGDLNHTGQSGGWATVGVPGIGGARSLSRGADGTVNTTIGVAGLPGGLIIAWFNDPLS